MQTVHPALLIEGEPKITFLQKLSLLTGCCFTKAEWKNLIEKGEDAINKELDIVKIIKDIREH